MKKIIVKSSLNGRCLENKELKLFSVADTRFFALNEILEQLGRNDNFKRFKKNGEYYHQELKKIIIVNQYNKVLFQN